MKEQQKPKTTDPQFILTATLSNITDLKEHELHLQKFEDLHDPNVFAWKWS